MIHGHNTKKDNLDLEFDKKHIWHPYTSLTNPLKVYPVKAAEGIYLQLQNGSQLIDGMSSWWAAIHGYNHPAINKAAQEQLSSMSHVMFGGITHAPAIQLCKQLVRLTPEGLDKVFLCDSGSVSVEVAMKMAIQYQQALGHSHKRNFLTLRKGYHGDTSGAMSVCDPVSGMHHLFQDFMPKHQFMQAPKLGYDYVLSAEDKTALAQFFEQYAADAVAFILEPIVQGAGGMRIYAPQYLQEIHRLCKEYGLLLIADEIATGFGRTGRLFACEHAQLCPDIMCLGKALTGGYLSMAATLCSSNVAEVICNGEAGVMMHGPTFMGNPLACAIASASIDVLTKSNWQQKVQQIERIFMHELPKAMHYALVQDVRVLGAIAVIETKQPVDVEKAQAYFVDKGVWLRPFRNLIYTMPPFIIDADSQRHLCHIMLQAVENPELFIH